MIARLAKLSNMQLGRVWYIGIMVTAAIICFVIADIAALTAYSVLTRTVVAKLCALIQLLASISGAMLAYFENAHLAASVLVVVSIFVSVNAGRILSPRMHLQQLRRRYARTQLIFSPLCYLLILLSLTSVSLVLFKVVFVAALIMTAGLLTSGLYSITKWSRHFTVAAESKNAPTVSVLVPARNETRDLSECIESILASTYEKLEVLVLDDCSHDKTPDIIKKYAHAGVRFIVGSEPLDSWLAKNQAMAKLAEESRGDIIIFAGVDVRFSPNTVSNLVTAMDTGYDMVSVLPIRGSKSEFSLFIQPIRYWWELVIPRFIHGRPPAVSTLWAIRKQSLEACGGFDSVKKSVQPEAHFADQLLSRYRFVVNNKTMGLVSVKRPREQYDTALRMRYPQLKRQPEQILMLLFLEVLLFVLPYIGLLANDRLIVWSSSAMIVMHVFINVLIARQIVSRYWFLAAGTVPVLAIQDCYIAVKSMIEYEFGTVIWKERNICLPLLSVTPKLPEIEQLAPSTIKK